MFFRINSHPLSIIHISEMHNVFQEEVSVLFADNTNLVSNYSTADNLVRLINGELCKKSYPD